MHPSGFPIRSCDDDSGELEVLRPTTVPDPSNALKFYLGVEDDMLVGFIKSILVIDPCKRPTPEEALKHAFLVQP